MIDLKQAIDALAEARPDPSAVEALTAETIRRKEKPYTAAELWGSCAIYGGRNQDAVNHCLLCGSVVNAYVTQAGRHEGVSEGMAQHLDWHNSIERRLRALGAA